MRTTAFVQSYFDAWNHSDPEAVAHHLAADGIYHNVPEAEQSTRDELIVDLEDFFADGRHRYELIGEILEGRNTLAFQYRMVPLARGEPEVCIHGAEFMTLQGDSALSIADYYEIPASARPPGLHARTRGTPKYAKSGLGEEKLADYKQRLEHIMHSRQLYLQPDLTLPELAQEVGCSVNHLSQVINAGFGTSFFDYLNRYRVDHAKGLLTDLGQPHESVVNVAFSVGFNSNSAFYSAFRKFVGQAPAQYRRKRQQRSRPRGLRT